MFIENHLKALKNTSNNYNYRYTGEIPLNWEQTLSSWVHELYLPVLISPLFLQCRNIGQIDISFVYKRKIFIIEAKRNQSQLKFDQFKRLKNAVELIGGLFEFDICFRVWTSKDLPKKESLFNLLK